MPGATTQQPASAETAKEQVLTGPQTARQRIESTPQYYLFRAAGGINWLFAKTRAEAMAVISPGKGALLLHYVNAGVALRVAQAQASHWKTQIVNLAGLEAAAAKDPELDDTAAAWTSPGKAKGR